MYIDLVFLLFALYGFWMGYRKGIIRTLFSLLSFVFGLLLTLKLAPYTIEFIENVFNADRIIALIVGVLLTMLVIMGVIKWIGRSIEKMLSKSKLGFFNKLQGGIILSFLMMVMYSVIIWFLDQTDLISDHQRAVSRTYDSLIELPGKFKAFLSDFEPLFKRFWQLVKDVIDDK